MLVERGGRHPEALGHRFDGDLRAPQQRPSRRQILGRERRGTPADAALVARRLKSGAGALANNGALELGQARENMKHQASAGGGGIDGLVYSKAAWS